MRHAPSNWDGSGSESGSERLLVRPLRDGVWADLCVWYTWEVTVGDRPHTGAVEIIVCKPVSDTWIDRQLSESPERHGRLNISLIKCDMIEGQG